MTGGTRGTDLLVRGVQLARRVIAAGAEADDKYWRWTEESACVKDALALLSAAEGLAEVLESRRDEAARVLGAERVDEIIDVLRGGFPTEAS